MPLVRAALAFTAAGTIGIGLFRRGSGDSLNSRYWRLIDWICNELPDEISFNSGKDCPSYFPGRPHYR